MCLSTDPITTFVGMMIKEQMCEGRRERLLNKQSYTTIEMDMWIIGKGEEFKEKKKSNKNDMDDVT